MSKNLDQSIDSAMSGSVVRSPVQNNKVRRNGQRTKVIDVVRPMPMPDVRQNIVRIIHECDPIGFLADVVNGKAIQTYTVNEDGTVEEHFETPTLPQRIKVAQHLAGKYVPTVSRVRHDHVLQPPGQGGNQDSQPQGGSTYQQMVEHASGKTPSGDHGEGT